MATPHLELAIGTFAAVLVIVVVAAAAGRLAERIGQARVVGEMIAGVLLGPALLGAVAPGVQAALFPEDVRSVLYVLSTLGLTIYMFLVGVDVDHGSARGPAAAQAAVLALAGIVPSFVLGGLVANAFYDRLAVPGTDRVVFVVFVGAALSITAFPMLARILEAEGLAGSRIGSLTLLAAAVDDAFAWVMLALVTALATAGSGAGVLPILGWTAVFTLAMLTVGRRLLAGLGERVERRGRLSHDDLAVVVGVVFAAGWLTDSIGIFSVFGGFVAGLAMPRGQVFRRELRGSLGALTMVALVPIFFAFSGLNTQVDGLGGAQLLWPLAAVLVVSFAGKYLGCAAVVRAAGFSAREASAIGALMNARGLMILVYITIGTAHDLVSPELFTVLVVVAIVTTAVATPLYRRSRPTAARPVPAARRPAGEFMS
jgi:Kef-type K+ transport system membrane component KefB